MRRYGDRRTSLLLHSPELARKHACGARAEVARLQNSALEVIGVAATSSGSAYVELTVAIPGRSGGLERAIVTVDRRGDEATLRRSIAKRLREHLDRLGFCADTSRCVTIDALEGLEPDAI